MSKSRYKVREYEGNWEVGYENRWGRFRAVRITDNRVAAEGLRQDLEDTYERLEGRRGRNG